MSAGGSSVEPADLSARWSRALDARGDAKRAVGQQAYMKSALPFFGVTSPQLAAISREILAPWPFEGPADWREAVEALWYGATHRELLHAALAVLNHKEALPYQGLRRTARAPVSPDAASRAEDALGLYQALIVSGAWWDLVDPIAANRLGPMLLEHNTVTTALMRAWALDSDIWLRRAAIISQLKLGTRTDRALLIATIEPALDAPEFWLRKAIGWALRQYARVEPAWVRATVASFGPRLSGLSRREALKHLG